jgi:hypothetical protein
MANFKGKQKKNGKYWANIIIDGRFILVAATLIDPSIGLFNCVTTSHKVQDLPDWESVQNDTVLKQKEFLAEEINAFF